MAEADVTLETILDLTDQLSLRDKVRLIQCLAPRIEHELGAQAGPHKPLRGLWKGLEITEQEIAAARQEMWGSFPRGDI